MRYFYYGFLELREVGRFLGVDGVICGFLGNYVYICIKVLCKGGMFLRNNISNCW